METWEIKPFVGVGPLEFGMTYKQVCLAMIKGIGELGSSFDEGKLQAVYWDSVHAEFEYPSRLVSVEIHSPLDPVYQGLHVLRTPYCDLRKWLHGGGITMLPSEIGLELPDLGLAVAVRIWMMTPPTVH